MESEFRNRLCGRQLGLGDAYGASNGPPLAILPSFSAWNNQTSKESDFVCTLFSLTESPTIAFQASERPATWPGIFFGLAEAPTTLRQGKKTSP